MADEPRIEELDKLIAKGKQKGFLTYDEVNDALPSDVVSLDQLDDIMLLFGSMDIELVDSTKGVRLPSEIEAPAEVDDDEPTDRRIDLTPGPVGRTEDPVRLYLREMGKVSLLTREGEITLAKRIEEGKDEATGATLSTTLAIDKIRLLRDKLRHDVIPIKDVVDYNEEESTEEKEAELRRSVIRELGNVDRLLREREKLQQQVRQIKAKNGTRKKDKGEPPWKKFDGQAQGKSGQGPHDAARPSPAALAPRRVGPGSEEAGREDPARGAGDRALVRRAAARADRGRRLPVLPVRRRRRRRPRPLSARRVEAPLDQGPAGVGRAAEDQARRGVRPGARR